MGSLIQLAMAALIAAGRADSMRDATIRMMAAALCAVLAVALTLACVGCAAAALWIFTLPALGPVGAPLAVAAALSGAALILATAAVLILRHRRRGPGPDMASLLPGATRLFNEHKGAALLAAVVAGMTAASGSRKS
jgi:hypothetical protein